MNFVYETACLTADKVRNKGKLLPLLTDHWRCQNACPLHVDIPRTDGSGSDLPFEAVLQEYLQFPNEYFLLVHLGGLLL
jgi:hypothetical protein